MVVLNRIGRKLRRRAKGALRRLQELHQRLVRPDVVETGRSLLRETASGTDLSERVVVVTGSSRGVGFAVARAMALARAKVVINGRTVSDLEKAAREIRDEGGAVVPVCADVSTESGAKKLLEAALSSFGRVDLLVNNAAIMGPVRRRAWDVTPSEWEEVLSINLTGAFLCLREAAAWMVRHGVAGRIITVSTGGARTLVPELAPYLVSKVGLEALTRAAALDAGWDGLTITGIELGSVQTRMTEGYFAWDDFQGLPIAETVTPIFLHAATAPREQVHGRVLAAWRFEHDADSETILTGPLALADRFAFPRPKLDGREVSRHDPQLVALDRAENVWGMPGKVRDLLAKQVHEFDFSRYPDEQYPTLRATLGKKLGLPEDCFTFGNGSSELVERLIRTFPQAGEEVLSNDPSWFMFDRFCATAGVINRKVPFLRSDDRLDHNLEGFLEGIGVNTRLIYLINPSNPLGVGIEADRFLRFIEQVPPHIPVVLDEAYVEYSTRTETLRSHELVFKTDRRVIGLRTFSKFYGLAGLRIGYAFAAPATLRLFNRLEPLFVLSRLAEAAAVAALEDEDHAVRTRNNMARERLRIQEFLNARGIASYPTETNLMLVEYRGTHEKLFQAFEDEGILVPKGVIYDRYVLFPVGRPEQNDRNLEILCTV